MAIVLGDNRYGKARVRLVRVDRAGDRHRLTDLTVDVTLAGELAASHLDGDNSAVLPTDTQKNTVYAFAREHGVGQPEEFGLRLARHFVDSQPAIHRARVGVEQHGWQRLGPHSFQRGGGQTRTCTASYDGQGAWVVSGVRDLALLNTAGSQFTGFAADRYTTLPEATDRILATAVTARWRHAGTDVDWQESYRAARDALVAAFAETYSHSLQQTLYAMGERVLARRGELVEVRLSLPNLHHLPVDLAPFGLDNPGEVFVATEAPYGLIEGTVTRDDAPAAGLAWW